MTRFSAPSPGPIVGTGAAVGAAVAVGATVPDGAAVAVGAGVVAAVGAGVGVAAGPPQATAINASPAIRPHVRRVANSSSLPPKRLTPDFPPVGFPQLLHRRVGVGAEGQIMKPLPRQAHPLSVL